MYLCVSSKETVMSDVKYSFLQGLVANIADIHVSDDDKDSTHHHHHHHHHQQPCGDMTGSQRRGRWLVFVTVAQSQSQHQLWHQLWCVCYFAEVLSQSARSLLWHCRLGDIPPVTLRLQLCSKVLWGLTWNKLQWQRPTYTQTEFGCVIVTLTLSVSGHTTECVLSHTQYCEVIEIQVIEIHI